MQKNIFSQITVLILTYRTNENILLNCLKSIDKRVKILVIENSTTFKNKKFFLKKFPNLKIQCTGANLGFGKGHNYGFKKISTNFVLTLSPDTICDKFFFKNLKKYIDTNFQFSLIGVNFYKKDKKIFGHLPYGYFSKNKIEKKFNKTLLQVDWVIGCAMLINLRMFKNKKIFDENIFMYFEDFDLCMRLLKNKTKVFSSKNLLIKHLGNSSSVAVDLNFKDIASNFRNWHWMWSQFYFYKKNYGLFYAYYNFFFKLIRFAFRMFVFIIFFNKKKFNDNKYRFLGLYNSMIGKKSWYRLDASQF